MAQVQALEKGIEPERLAPPPGFLALGADPGQIAYRSSCEAPLPKPGGFEAPGAIQFRPRRVDLIALLV